MFVVYTPEGRQSFPLETLIHPVEPVGKVEPVTAIRAEKFAADVPLASEARRAWLKHRALHAYRQQHQADRKWEAWLARGVMEPVEVTLTEDMLLASAWGRLDKAHQRCAVVLEARDQPVGLLCQKDFLGHVWQERRRMRVRTATVADIMRTPVLSCHLHVPIRYIALVMSRQNLEVMPVVTEADQVLGVVTAHRVMQQLAQCCSMEMIV